MASNNLIDFDLIETQKENIQSLPGGRSAKALTNILSSGPEVIGNLSETQTLNDAIRREYEQEIQESGESDDPLDIYDRYVKWTLNAYPSAQATPQSGLLPLLERATKAFLSSPDYKNDPRYLRLWLHYIRLFSDAPRETFAFLSRHSIGENLALFYEEFAAWLEGAGRIIQAEEVYELGLQRQARPSERLMRKYREFNARVEQWPTGADRPTSPALPKVRPALAAKVDPFASARMPSNSQAQSRNGIGSGSGSTRTSKPKMAIFSDTNGSAAGNPATSDRTKGWENIGSLKERKKENIHEPKPWVGETLKAGGSRKPTQKMQVFKDESSQSQSCESSMPKKPSNLRDTVNQRTGKVERVFVDLEAMYPDPHNPKAEMSLEELRAQKRGWMDINWSRQKHALKEISGNGGHQGENSLAIDFHKLTIPDGEQMHDEDDHRDGKGARSRRLKVREVKGQTQTIQTKLDSPTGPKMKRKNSSEPTMTFHTRAATDEIYDIFNQPLKAEQAADGADSVCEGDYYDDDDYTSIGETTGHVSGASEFGEEDTTTFFHKGAETEDDTHGASEWTEFNSHDLPEMNGKSDSQSAVNDDEDEINEGMSALTEGESEEKPVRKRFIPVPPDDYDPPTGPYRDAAAAAENRLPFMTPIIEQTETSFPGTTYTEGKYAGTKTPVYRSKPNFTAATPVIPEADDLLLASPSQAGSEISGLPEELSPIRAVKRPRPSPEKPRLVRRRVIINDRLCNPVSDEVKETILRCTDPPLDSFSGYHSYKGSGKGYLDDIRKFIKASTSKSSRSSGGGKSQSATPVLSFRGSRRSYSIKRHLGEGGYAAVYLAESADVAASSESESDNGGGEDSCNPSGASSSSSFDFSASASSKLAARRPLEALKIEGELNSAWEFYMLETVHRRLANNSMAARARARDSVVRAQEMHRFADTGYLVEEYENQGTLIDLVNLARAPEAEAGAGGGGLIDETVAMFFAVELFRTVEALHSVGVLHGDIKADNFLVRLNCDPPQPASSPSLLDIDENGDTEPNPAAYSPYGSGVWRHNGVKLIDFGRGIDARAFPQGVQFIADWQTGAHECVEMREARPWTVQVDLYGLAATVHVLLFGRYMDVVPVVGGGSGGGMGKGNNKTYRVKEGLKRYWERDLWADVFDVCLNPGSARWQGVERAAVAAARERGGGAAAVSEWGIEDDDDDENAETGGGFVAGGGAILPVLASMREIRERMEDWLVANAERRGLYWSLCKLEMMLGRSRGRRVSK